MIQNNSSKTAQVWADRLERFEQADITVAQFCQNENVSKASYYYWRRKIRSTTRTDYQRLRESTSASPRQTARKPAGFLPVRLAAPPSLLHTKLFRSGTKDNPAGCD